MKKIKGFTLIELMVVLAIITIFTALVAGFVGGKVGSITEALQGVRCVAGYKVLVGPYNNEQMRDVDNRPIPCQ